MESVTNFSNLKSDNFVSKLFFNYKKVLQSSVEDDLLFLLKVINCLAHFTCKHANNFSPLFKTSAVSIEPGSRRQRCLDINTESKQGACNVFFQIPSSKLCFKAARFVKTSYLALRDLSAGDLSGSDKDRRQNKAK